MSAAENQTAELRAIVVADGASAEVEAGFGYRAYATAGLNPGAVKALCFVAEYDLASAGDAVAATYFEKDFSEDSEEIVAAAEDSATVKVESVLDLLVVVVQLSSALMTEECLSSAAVAV